MTASELVDLAAEGALAASPGDVWLADRSWTRPQWTVEELEAAKAGRTISVVLPALNEEDTVESVIESISPLVGGLVDELIVLDSGSTDDTEIRAIAAGARVVTREQALPEIAPRPGKGEVLWRSLAATSGDFVVFVDSDLIEPHPMFVPRLLGPLLTDDGIHLVKSFYRRPLNTGDAPSGREGATGGGRVTELVATAAAGRAAARAGLRSAAAGRRIRRHPRTADVGAVRARLRRRDRSADRHLRPAGPGRDRPGEPRCAGAPQPAAGRAGADEPSGRRDAVVALRHPGLRRGADPVLRRRRRLHPAHLDGVAGRPAADERPSDAPPLAGACTTASDR